MANRKILFVCWSGRPIHGTLINAAFEALRTLHWECFYAGTAASAPSLQTSPQKTRNITSPFRLISSLLFHGRGSFDAIFFQSVHPANVAIGLWAKINKIPIVYYLHEPSGIKEKLGKGDPSVYAFLVWITQYLETKLSDYILVATEALINQARSCFPRSEAQIAVLPLAIPNLTTGQIVTSSHKRNRILYLGRANSMRCLDEFFELAIALDYLGGRYRTTILTYNDLSGDNSPIDVRSGKTYTDQEMLELLNDSFLVWNVYSVNYSQSGVTPVALRSGVPLLISKFENEKHLVQSRVAFEVKISPFNPEQVTELIDNIYSDFECISKNCLKVYNDFYSPVTLASHFKNIQLFKPRLV